MKDKKRGILFKLITFIGFIILIFVALALSKEIYRRYQINQEIKSIQEEIERLEKRNQELQALVDYLNSDSYKEIQARQNLGLQKPGEQAIAVQPAPPNLDVELQASNREEEKNLTNPEKWWNYFFAKKSE
ncbi:MAG: septum formation initiator family protein [Patescibacteria group bacterium]